MGAVISPQIKQVFLTVSGLHGDVTNKAMGRHYN